MLDDSLEGSLAELFSTATADDPIGLARLIELMARSESVSKTVLPHLQAFLLTQTLRFCVENVPYYARLPFRDAREINHLDAAAFESLPLLSRQMVQDNATALVAKGERLQQVIHTSGSTGEPLQIFKSAAELEFLRTFFGALIRKAVPAGGERPLVLSLPNLYHGSAVALPSIGLPLVSGVGDDTLLPDAVNILKRDHCIPGFARRVSVISGLYFQVLFLTSYLQEIGVDPAGLNISYINITGGYISPYWLKYLRNTWNCMVNDRYSLTEAVGGASRQDEAGTFRLDPFIIGEIVDVDTHEVISDGVGELVLTSLFPLVRMQPLLRYRTGDLVFACEVRDKRVQAFQFLGKAKNCQSEVSPAGRRTWLAFSATIMDILAPLPDVKYYDWFSNVSIARDRSIATMPMFRFEPRSIGGPGLHLRIELRYSPQMYPERVQTLRALILQRLREDGRSGFEAWERAQSGRAAIDFVGPGGMGGTPAIKV